MDENKCDIVTKSFDNSMASSHPLLSTVVTLYTLIFLYFPTTLLLSPLLFSTSLVLLSLLRIGASQRKQTEPENPVIKPDPDSETPPLQVPYDSSESQNERGSVLDPDPTPFHLDSFVRGPMEVKDAGRKPEQEPYFVEWNVRAPLEVIYEAYEGEGEEEEDGRIIERYAEEEEEDGRIIERYASLSMYYPETDTDSYSSEEENVCFRWEEEEEEEDKEGLIEIELDTNRKTNSNTNDFEEDNLIEIDLNFPAT